MSNSMPSALRASGRWGVRALTSGALAVGLLTAAPMTTDAHAPTRHHRAVERKVDDATRVAATSGATRTGTARPAPVASTARG